MSTTEAEYIALGEGAQEAAWMRELYDEIVELYTPHLITNNKGASELAKNRSFHR